jgi:hypothetical protein
MARPIRSDCERFHRRDFLKLGAAGLLGLGLADVLRWEGRAGRGVARKKATSVIMLWLAGGPATIDIWDLKPDAPDDIRGDFKPIDTSARGVRICEHLPRVARLIDRCTLVRSLHHNIPEHGVATRYVTTGNLPTPALDYPSLGSLTARLLPAATGLPPYVAFAEERASAFVGGPGYLGAAYGPFEVAGDPRRGKLRVEGLGLPDDFSLADLADRSRLRNTFDARFRALDAADLPASLDKFQREALDILRSEQTRTAFDLDREPAAIREAYGGDGFGQGCLAARRLIQAGVRFVTVGLGGWDTHAGNFGALRGSLLPTLDRTLAALLGDLDQRGLLDTTLVYCAGEFGRTPKINLSAGRDHWAQAMAVLLAGGGIARGAVHGSTDGQGMSPATDPCSPDDVAATVFNCLGLDPGYELHTSTGRPIALFREGRVIDKLIG